MTSPRGAVTSSQAVRTFLRTGMCSVALCRVLNKGFDHPLELEEKASELLAGGILSRGYQCGQVWGSALPRVRRRAGSWARVRMPRPRGRRRPAAHGDLPSSLRELRLSLHHPRRLRRGGRRAVDQGRGPVLPQERLEVLPHGRAVRRRGVRRDRRRPFRGANRRSLPTSELRVPRGAEHGRLGSACGHGGRACGRHRAERGRLRGAGSGALAPRHGRQGARGGQGRLQERQSPGADRPVRGETGSRFECADIVGRRFESIDDHAAFLRDGGCANLIELLAAR